MVTGQPFALVNEDRTQGPVSGAPSPFTPGQVHYRLMLQAAEPSKYASFELYCPEGVRATRR